jgi:hypothetical protein
MKKICAVISLIAVGMLSSGANAADELEVEITGTKDGPKYLAADWAKENLKDLGTKETKIVWIGEAASCPRGVSADCTERVEFTGSVTFTKGTEISATVSIPGVSTNALKAWYKNESSSISQASTYTISPGKSVVPYRALPRHLTGATYTGVWEKDRVKYICYDPTDCFKEKFWDVYKKNTSMVAVSARGMIAQKPYKSAKVYNGSGSAHGLKVGSKV